MANAWKNEASKAIDVLLFDLDGTLFPLSNGYNERMIRNIYEFMHKKYDIPREKVPEIWKALFSKYNQTYCGLIGDGYKVDKDEFWVTVREGVEDYLTPNPELRRLLESLPQRKWILTNAQEVHALKALSLLQLDGLFEGVLGSDFMGNTCKPHKLLNFYTNQRYITNEKAFDIALERIGVLPERVLFFEDSYKNIVGANALGIKTVYIDVYNRNAVPSNKDAADIRIKNMIDLSSALPSLWPEHHPFLHQ